MPITQLSYLSCAKSGLKKSDFTTILDKAITGNSKSDITGILVYCNGFFFQVLEGDDTQVLALFNKIVLDHRHENVVKLQHNIIQDRVFDKWNMAFKSYNTALKTLDNFNDEEFHPFIHSKTNNENNVTLGLLADFFRLNS
jgi:hypothetical protein